MERKRKREAKERSQKLRLVYASDPLVKYRNHFGILLSAVEWCLPSLAFRRTVLATIFSISIVRM